MNIDFTPFLLTFKLSVVTTGILLVVGTFIASWLANTTSKAKPIIESVVALPIVLPPTVLGFYLLLLFNPDGLFGNFWSLITSQSLAFSFSGLVFGSVIYSLPFVVQPLQNSFESIPSWSVEIASTLRASKIDIFFSIILPLCKRGYITAIVLGFAHTLGEFGIVLMIGGNIPGETQVISIAIYENVENLNYLQAHILSFIMLLFSFVILYIMFLSQKISVNHS